MTSKQARRGTVLTECADASGRPAREGKHAHAPVCPACARLRAWSTKRMRAVIGAVCADCEQRAVDIDEAARGRWGTWRELTGLDQLTAATTTEGDDRDDDDT